jgi:hypothetical protein
MSERWPLISYSEMPRPAPEWRVDHAVLATYSADLVAAVTALLALSGADLDPCRTGSRTEVVRAIEALRGRVRVAGQKGRIILPERVQPILALLDQFVTEVELDESIRSWHPKAALLRFVHGAKTKEYQWRLWIGSRNLTRSLNWEAGLMIESRADWKGDRVEGVGELGADPITRANLPGLSAQQAGDKLNRLTWDCPLGVMPQSVQLLGGGSSSEFPRQPEHIAQAILISPFLDVEPELREKRYRYRLALGQPQQQDFIEQVGRHGDDRSKFILNLSTWQEPIST